MELVKGAVYSSPDVQDRATNGLCGSEFRFIIYNTRSDLVLLGQLLRKVRTWRMVRIDPTRSRCCDDTCVHPWRMSGHMFLATSDLSSLKTLRPKQQHRALDMMNETRVHPVTRAR